MPRKEKWYSEFTEKEGPEEALHEVEAIHVPVQFIRQNMRTYARSHFQTLRVSLFPEDLRA